jgi:hypothetical protein
MGFLAGMIGLGAGCGGSSEDPSCVSKDGFICQPSRFPFVEIAAAAADGCASTNSAYCALSDVAANPPATLTQPRAGKLCLSGTVAAGGWAQIVLQFAMFDKSATKVVKSLDANARGITQVAFTIDSPPSGGVTAGAAVVTSLECPSSPFDCFTYGFGLMTAPLSNIPLTITQAGPQVAPFADFEQTRSGVSQTFDTSVLMFIQFGVGPAQGDYDFCVQDFKFLDAAGNEVKP